MFNPNRKQKIESEELTYSKEPITLSGPKSIQKKPADLHSLENTANLAENKIGIT